MNGLREKIRNKKGFTLVEMLIVVAIIAILIAVSIPLVSNALERARHATDAANERAAKAEILILYLAGNDAEIDGTTGAITFDKIYYYDATDGRVTGTAPTGAKATYGQHKNHKLLAIKVSEDGVVTMQWDATSADDIKGENLCSAAENVDHTATP